MQKELELDGIIVSKGRAQSENVEIGPSKHAGNALAGAFPLADHITIKNTPKILDFNRYLTIYASLGAKVDHDDNGKSTLDNTRMSGTIPSTELVEKVRASILLLSGALLRSGHISMPIPQGDWPGTRPTSSTINIAREFGAKIHQTENKIEATLDKRVIENRKIDVNGKVFATLAAMILATGVGGKTIIENPLSSLEVDSLAEFLTQLGSQISGLDSNQLVIESDGLTSLKSNVEVTLPPDACETMFWLVYAKLHNLNLNINFPHWKKKVTPKQWGPLFNMSGFMRHTHAIIDGKNETAIVPQQNLKQLEPADIVFFDDKRGLPRDAAPVLAILFGALDAISTYDDEKYGIRRVEWMRELRKVGGRIEYYYNDKPARATIFGNSKYKYEALKEKTILNGTDIRSAAALALAASTSDIPVGVTGLSHILRSYTDLPQKMSKLGTNVHFASQTQS